MIVLKRSSVTLSEGKDVTVDFGRSIVMKFVWISTLDMWFSETEVTIGEYSKYNWVDSSIPYFETWPGYSPTWPAMNIQAISAERFCRFLSHRVILNPIGHFEIRLPTEAEWETAARCGDRRTYPWGDNWPPAAMSDGNYPNLNGDDAITVSGRELPVMYKRYPGEKWIHGYRDRYVGPCPVNSSGRNENGLYGMAGNVMEWCRRADGVSVLKGGAYYSYSPEVLKIANGKVLDDRPWPFLPLLRDRKSNYGTGFRVVIGRK